MTLDDSFRLALLVLMQRLSVAERLIFVMHDDFQMPFEDTAETVGRPGWKVQADRPPSAAESRGRDGGLLQVGVQGTGG